jgi:hypothetical protein
MNRERLLAGRLQPMAARYRPSWFPGLASQGGAPGATSFLDPAAFSGIYLWLQGIPATLSENPFIAIRPR